MRAKHSTVANGKVRLRTLSDLDGRTAAAKRSAALVTSLITDLGGEDNVSTAKRQVVQHAAITGAMAEDDEARWLAGEEINFEEYLAKVKTQKLLFCSIGLERHAKDVTPSVEEYARTKYGHTSR